MPELLELQELNFQLRQLNKLFHSIQEEDSSLYSANVKVFDGQTIGAHVRHLLEFIQLYQNSNSTTINYGLRSRDISIERSLNTAIELTEELIDQLEVNSDICVHISESGSKQETSPERELVFLADHAIHHMAIIGIAMRELGYKHLLPKYFGIAPSTIKHLQNQAS